MISKHIDQRLEHMNQLYEDLNKYDCRILSIMKERSKLL